MDDTTDSPIKGSCLYGTTEGAAVDITQLLARIRPLQPLCRVVDVSCTEVLFTGPRLRRWPEWSSRSGPEWPNGWLPPGAGRVTGPGRPSARIPTITAYHGPRMQYKEDLSGRPPGTLLYKLCCMGQARDCLPLLGSTCRSRVVSSMGTQPPSEATPSASQCKQAVRTD